MIKYVFDNVTSSFVRDKAPLFYVRVDVVVVVVDVLPPIASRFWPHTREQRSVLD